MNIETENILFCLQHLCGTDPHPTQFRAKKYKLDQRFMEKKDFLEMMQVSGGRVVTTISSQYRYRIAVAV